MEKTRNSTNISRLSVLLLVFLILVGPTVPGVVGVLVELPLSGTKCLSEEIQPNVVVLADYSLTYEVAHPDITIGSKVTSPYGKTLHDKENVKAGQFAFTTTEPGSYLACFWIDSADKGVGTSLSLDWKIGIATRDWDSVARKEKIEGVELEVTKLEALVVAIHEKLEYLKLREAEMREVSERTNGRVAWYSIMSIGICIVVSVLQSVFLKRFFRKKKLI